MHFTSPLIHRAFWHTLICYEREYSYKPKCFISAVTKTLQKQQFFIMYSSPQCFSVKFWLPAEVFGAGMLSEPRWAWWQPHIHKL